MEPESSDESSSANSPPNSYAQYFHNGMFLAQSWQYFSDKKC